MSDETNSSDDLIYIRVMNEYGGDLPLWPDDIDDDVDDLDLSEGLRSDLMTFADRWDAAIDPEVTDDRWTGAPVMQTLVSATRWADSCIRPESERQKLSTRTCVAPATPSQCAFRTNSARPIESGTCTDSQPASALHGALP